MRSPLPPLAFLTAALVLGCEAPADKTCGAGTRLTGTQCLRDGSTEGAKGGSSSGGRAGSAGGGGKSPSGGNGGSVVPPANGDAPAAGTGGTSAAGSTGSQNAGKGGSQNAGNGGSQNAGKGGSQNAGHGGTNAAGSGGGLAAAGSGGSAGETTCGIVNPSGDEAFVLAATQWRLATFLYLRHFGQDNTAEVKASMTWARDHGFNAVTLPASWDELEITPGDVGSGSQFALLESVLEHAKTLGLKVRLNLWLNRFFKAPNDLDPQTPFYGPDDLARSQDGSSEGDLSFHAPRLGNAFAFVKRTLVRTKPWHDAGVIGWYSVVHNTTAELGYAHSAGSADYGTPALAAFRSWLHDPIQNPRPFADVGALNAAWGTTYGSFDDAAPPSLSGYQSQDVFAGRRGEDFWRFREHGIRLFLGRLRTTLDQTVDATWARPVRVVNDYGSVYDRLGPARQSQDFSKHLELLGPYGYGVKQNADNAKPLDEQRFAMDLLTSRAHEVGAASFNEAFLQGLPTSQWADVVQAWLDAGANGFSVYSNFASTDVQSQIAALADELGKRGYWGGPVRCPQYQGAVATKASGLVHGFWDAPQADGSSYFDRYKAASKGKNARFSFENDLWP